MKSKIIKGVILFYFLFFILNLSAQSIEKQILGLWSVEDIDHSIVEFEKSTEGLWDGTIVSTDVDRSIGKLLFTEGIYNSKTQKIVGLLIHPDSGIRVTGTLKIENKNNLKVVASKFILFKTFNWIRDEG